jgi:histidyl-tRNA synthetase
VENIENLTGSEGGENLMLIYRILKRGDKLNLQKEGLTEDDLADLGLRYDLTVPLSRFYCNNRAKLLPVFKALQVGNVFRAERAQKGRYRSFKQCDIDIIGDGTIAAELELIATTAKALTALNVKDFVVRFNDRRILKAVILNCGFKEEDFDGVCIIVDKLDKIGMEGVEGELRGKGCPEAAVENLMKALDEINKKGTECLYEYGVPDEVVSDVKKVLEESNIYAGGKYEVVFDFTLVRGMGYYTGSIFEIAYKDLGYSIAGGGRYDEMVGNFIGEKIPAIGFSIGFERLVNQLMEENFKVPDLDKVVLLYEPDDRYNKQHNITPKSVIKGVRDVIEATKAAEEEGKYKTKDKDISISEYIIELEKEMRLAADNLEFEKAAYYRDQIKELRKNNGQNNY